MRRQPRELRWVAFLLALVAAAMPPQVFLAHGYPLAEWGRALSLLAPMNWIVLTVCLATAVAVWRASAWSLALMPASILLVGVNNATVAAASPGLDGGSAAVPWLASFGFVLLFGPLLRPAARAALLDSRRRWWLTPSRSKISLPVRLKVMPSVDRSRFGGPRECREIITRTFDVSERGAFIPLIPDATRARERLPVGTQCFISLALDGMDYLQCRAEVVRLAAGSAGHYPGGVGIRFLGLSWAEQRRFRSFLRAVPAA